MKKDKNLKLIRSFGTWFGLGDFPKMPGTIGTLGGIPLFLILNFVRKFFPNMRLYYSFYLLFLIIFFMFAVYVSNICEEEIFKEKDPQNVVIDEVVGYLTTLFFIAPDTFIGTIRAIIVAFIIFRILDITKPGPIYKSQDFTMGIGVVLDDFLAGVVGNFIMICIWTLFKWT
jgi:phosphatidylglycerophosphatase A